MALEKDLFTAILFSIWQGIVLQVNKAQTHTHTHAVSHKVLTQKRSPLCGAWPAARWLRRPWISEACVAPPCCESPAASGSAAGPPGLALACRSLPVHHGKYMDEHIYMKTYMKKAPSALLKTKKIPKRPDRSSSYPVAPRCRSGCRKRGCWAEVAVVCVCNAGPGPHGAVSCTGAGRRRSRTNLDWPPPPGHQAETPDSLLRLITTHQPWGRGKRTDFKHSQQVGHGEASER